MKKGKILKFLTASILSASILGFNLALPVSAELVHQYTHTPQLCCTLQQLLTKNDNSGLTNYLAHIEGKDKHLDILFNNVKGDWSGWEPSYPLPEPPDGEEYFIALKDIDKGGKTIKYEVLNISYDGVGGKTYSCSINLPYYYDRLELCLYTKKTSDANYVEDQQKLLGKTRFIMPHDSVYRRQDRKGLTVLDKSGSQIGSPATRNFIARRTPNNYSIECPEVEVGYIQGRVQVGRIVLPSGQKNLMNEEDKIVPSTKFLSDQQPEEGQDWKNGFYGENTFFNLYIPDGITEFTFQVFDTNVTENADDILYQFHINLSK